MGNHIWADTARRVAVYQRTQWQAAAAAHPALFFLAWGLKVVLVDVPVSLVRGLVSLVRARRSRAGRELVPAQGGETDG